MRGATFGRVDSHPGPATQRKSKSRAEEVGQTSSGVSVPVHCALGRKGKDRNGKQWDMRP